MRMCFRFYLHTRFPPPWLTLHINLELLKNESSLIHLLQGLDKTYSRHWYEEELPVAFRLTVCAILQHNCICFPAESSSPCAEPSSSVGEPVACLHFHFLTLRYSETFLQRFPSMFAVVDNSGLNLFQRGWTLPSHSKASCYSDSFVGVRLTRLDLWPPFYHLICLFISLVHFPRLNENINWPDCVHSICKMMLLFCQRRSPLPFCYLNEKKRSIKKVCTG